MMPVISEITDYLPRPSESLLRTRDTSDAGINPNSRIQSPRERLEDRLRHMVGIAAVEDFHVDIGQQIVGNGAHKLPTSWKLKCPMASTFAGTRCS